MLWVRSRWDDGIHCWRPSLDNGRNGFGLVWVLLELVLFFFSFRSYKACGIAFMA